MTALRYPLFLAALVLASCWLAYDLGKQSVPKKIIQTPSRENRPLINKESRTDRDRTRVLLSELDDCVTADDFRGALDQLQFQADKTEENRLLSAFFRRWLEVSPIDALSEVRRVESLRHDILRTSRVFEQWAIDRPDDASELLRKLLDGRQTEASSRPPFLDGVDPPEYVLSLFSGLAIADPQGTAKLLQEVKVSPIMANALDVLLQNWFPENSEAVFQWSSALKQSPFRQEVLSRTAQKAGQLDDVSHGLAWARTLDSRDQGIALKSLTHQWAQRHSREAFRWVIQQPDDLKFELAPAVISSLSKIDPGAAADWLNQFEPSSQMDPSIAAYALGISTVNLEAALGSAAAITDQEMRQRVIRRMTRE